MQSTMELLYAKKDFIACLDHFYAYESFCTKRQKTINYKEILEIASRSARHLKRYSEALALFDRRKCTKEPGPLFYRAQLLLENERYQESLDGFQLYLRDREGDYLAWQWIGKVFEMAYAQKDDQAAIYANAAYQCYRYSIKLLKRNSVEGELKSRLENHALSSLVGYLNHWKCLLTRENYDLSELEWSNGFLSSVSVQWIYKTIFHL
jgi:hypothetical protein